MAQISSLCSTILDLPPSCLVFCPSRPAYCVVGTYFLHPATDAAERTVPSERKVDGGDGSGVLQEQAQLEDDEDVPQAQGHNTPQKRTGSLRVFQVDRNQSKMTEISTLTAPYAVLDAQWSPHPQQGELLAVAASTGKILIYRFDVTSPKDPRLVLLDEFIVADPSILVLSLAWHPENPSIIGFTLSNGEVNTCTFAPSSSHSSTADATTSTVTQSHATPRDDLQIHNIHTHSLEAWTLAFTLPSWHGDAIFSGGDDQYLRFSPLLNPALDTSINSESPSSSLPSIAPWQDRRVHSAGVTAILPLSPPLPPYHANLVVTGSYDDHIRLLRAPGDQNGRKQKRCEVLAELDLGGGVWRLKILQGPPTREVSGDGAGGESADGIGEQAVPSISSGNNVDRDGIGNEILILASCMHAGTRIVALRRITNGGTEEGSGDDERWEFVVRARFEEHESMNYGSDVQPPLSPSSSPDSSAEPSSTHVIVSSSFYDRRVCLWEF